MRLIAVLIAFMVSMTAYAQRFNVEPQGHVSGLPGGEMSDLWGYVHPVSGKEHVIIGSLNAITIFDISDCKNPVQVWQFVDGASTIWREFSEYQGYGYAVCDRSGTSRCREGLQIINLTTYAVTQDSSTFTKAHNIFIDVANGRLYAVGSDATGGQLIIYTLDTEVVNGVTYAGTPANPVLLKKHPTSYIHDIYVKDNLVFASHGYDGFRVWDVSNVNSIVERASFADAGGYNHSSWMTPDNYIYMCDELPRGREMKIYKLNGSGTNLSLTAHGTFEDPVESPTFTNPRPHNPYIKGDTLYVSYYEDGVVMWDISNRTDPKRIGYYDTYTAQNGLGYNIAAHDWKGPWAAYPYFNSGCIAVSDITQGLYTFKLDMPVDDGNQAGVVTKVTGDIVLDSQKGIILRNAEGYCYRMTVNNAGALQSTQVICHDKSLKYSKMYETDLAFTSSSNGVVLRSPGGQCYRLGVNASGQLSTTSTTCTPTSSHMKANSQDIVIETGTKGIILSNGTSCYRVKVSSTGTLTTTLLNACP
jgi:choice-of-anchor B domain-containing protein